MGLQKKYYHIPAGNYMFKVNNRNARTRCKICSELSIKTPERRRKMPTGKYRKAQTYVLRVQCLCALCHINWSFYVCTMSRKTHNPREKVEYLSLSSIYIVGNIDNMMRNSFRLLWKNFDRVLPLLQNWNQQWI